MNTNLNREGFFYIPYFEIIAWKYRKEHSKTFASVYGSIFRICEISDTGICFASVRHTISKRVGVSAKQFGNTLDKIVSDGFIKELPNDGHSTKAYTIDLDKLNELQIEFDKAQIGIVEERVAVVETTTPLSSFDYGVKSKLPQPVVETTSKHNIVVSEDITELEEKIQNPTVASKEEAPVSPDPNVSLSREGYMISPIFPSMKFNYHSLEERESMVLSNIKNRGMDRVEAETAADSLIPMFSY